MPTKNKVKSFFIDFLFINLVALTGAGVIFLFQLLISMIKKLVLITVEPTTLNIILYILFILLASFLEYILLKRKKTIRKKLHYLSFLEKHRMLDSVIDVIESIFCCLLTFMIALPLGSEGPSVYIGFMIENFYRLLFYKEETTLDKNRFGSMMGYALAFLNPIAGFFFYFEKKNRRGTSKQMFLQVYLLLVSFAWILLFRYLYGMKDFYLYSLYNRNLEMFSNRYFNLFVLLIPVITLFISFFYKRFIMSLAYYVKANDTSEIFFSIVMALVTVLSLKFTGYDSFIGFSDEIFLSTEELLLDSCLFYFFIRFFWTIFSNDIYYQGGHVIPTFVVGGSIGMVLSSILSSFYPLTREDQSLIIVLSALCFFASVTMNYLTTMALCLSFGPGYILIPYMIIPISIIYMTIRLSHAQSLPDLIKHVKENNDSITRALKYYKYLKGKR